VKVSGVIRAGAERAHGRAAQGLDRARRPADHRRVLAALAPAVDDVLVVTNTPELYAFLELPMVGDVYPDHGSLGGIYSGLEAAAARGAHGRVRHAVPPSRRGQARRRARR
jgi:hypothetical protein